MSTIPFVPRPMLGAHRTAMTLTGMAVASDGSLSVGAVFNVLVQHRGLTLGSSVERAEINGASTTRQNEVILSNGRTASLEIFQVNNGSDPDPLETLQESYDYIKLAWVQGTAAGSIQSYVGYFVRGEVEMQGQGRGEVIATMQLGPCDPGVAQVVRTIS